MDQALNLMDPEIFFLEEDLLITVYCSRFVLWFALALSVPSPMLPNISFPQLAVFYSMGNEVHSCCSWAHSGVL